MGERISKQGLLGIQVPVQFVMGGNKKNVKECLEFKKGYSFKLEESEAGNIAIQIAGKTIAIGKPVRKNGIMHVRIIEML
ncbi:FliM/FliN family flagellar motor switch protein [Bacillus bombysepticus]|uniref:FliM/FliN family flagellar motor switch protein n=1 Tax=Bacillus bombysepticus TaxID=658666 RepID=UPI00301883C3